MTDEKKIIIDAIESKSKVFCDISDKIWDFAEVRFDLRNSADLLCNYLEQEGFTIERGLSGMNDAFIATYGSEGPVIGILGEYDALSGMSQSAGQCKKEVLVEGGAGHGCGHQLLAAGALAGAIGLKEYLSKAGESGIIKYFGCPAEESGSGKAFLARDGAFTGVDAFLTWHPMSETGAFGCSTLANYQVYFHFKGRSSHAAAAPHEGRSALDACELMNVGVNYLREHIVPEARVHYAYIDTGGPAPNVVQASSTLLYFIRAPKSSQVHDIYLRVLDIAKGAALMTGTSMELEWDSACAEYILNSTLLDAMYKNMVELGPVPFDDEDFEHARGYSSQLDDLTKNFLRSSIAKKFPGESRERLDLLASKPLLDDIVPLSISEEAMPGSTDVSDASWHAPTVQFVVGCYPQGTPPHSWQWVATGKSSVVHKGLLHSGKILALTALDIIKNPELLKKAKEEFKDRLAGETYNCAIPKDVISK
ncbi:MAG: M20 family metallopeptidase [Treponema sp.]|nr:M20 family metallopeptidase [Treponema sp.]